MTLRYRCWLALIPTLLYADGSWIVLRSGGAVDRIDAVFGGMPAIRRA